MKLQSDDEILDEKKSLEIIKATIQTSKRLLKDDGLLLIFWGFGLSLGGFWKYYKETVLTAWWMRDLMLVIQIAGGIALIGLTAYFIFFRRKKVTTYTSISTRFVWIGVILAHNMIVMITKNILSEINFTLLQPLQLVLIGFALFVSGGIYRYYYLSVSGVLMWVAAVIAANYQLTDQFLVRAIAMLVCFIIPGVLMYSTSKN